MKLLFTDAAMSVLWILDILSLPTTLSSFSFFVGMHQVCNCGELCVLTLPKASHFPVLIGLMGEWKKNGFTNCHLAWVMTIDKLYGYQHVIKDKASFLKIYASEMMFEKGTIPLLMPIFK